MYAYENGRRAVENHYKRLGIPAHVELDTHLGYYRTIYQWPDSPLLSKLIVECLKKAGYTNLIVNMNGQEGWDKLVEFHKRGTVLNDVHLIITDIEMPLMDGHRLCKLVKENETLKNIPVIIFSSLINDEIRRKGESLGADAQLTKPEIGKLISVVDELVAKYEVARKGN